MEIQERQVGDVTILDLRGKMTLGEGETLLKAKIKSVIQRGGHRKLLINLQAVPYIDSSGLIEIVRSYAIVSRQGGKLKLYNLTARIQDLLAITRLMTVWEIFEDEASALASFRDQTGN